MDPSEYAHLPVEEFRRLCRVAYLETARELDEEAQRAKATKWFSPDDLTMETSFQRWLMGMGIKPFPLYPDHVDRKKFDWFLKQYEKEARREGWRPNY